MIEAKDEVRYLRRTKGLLGILFLAVSMLPNAADFIFTQMKVIVVDFVEGMT